MNTIELLKKLKNYSTFTTIDIQRLLASNKRYAEIKIARLLKQKYISRISSGVYTTNNSIVEIASNIVTPCYLSGWYVSNYKGYTEQIVNTLCVFTTINKKQITFENYKIKFIKTKYLFGYYKENNTIIANDNKSLIDAIMYPELFGNFDEIINIVKKGNFNKSTIIEYLKIINKKSIIKKAGYLLDTYRNIGISELKIDNNYVILDQFSNTKKIKNKKWKVKI